MIPDSRPRSIWLIPIFSLVVLMSCGSDEEVPSAAPAPSFAPPSAQAMTVEGFVVTPQTMARTLEATGSLLPNEAVPIQFERNGRLEKLYFQEGANVKAGQLLAEIDDSELLAQKKKLEVSIDLAEKQVARGKELVAIQAMSQEEYDRLLNSIESIKADLALNEILIGKSKIYAPFSGTLGLRQVSEGAYIGPSDVIIDLYQIHLIKLEFDVPERFLPEMKTGQNLTFTVVGQDKPYEARVYAIGTELNPETRTVRVRGIANNPQQILKPGQFAKVQLVTSVTQEAVLVPTDAIVPILDGKEIFVARGGTAQAINVRTGERRDAYIEVLNGIKIGDTVIVSGLMSVANGSKIVINRFVQP